MKRILLTCAVLLLGKTLLHAQITLSPAKAEAGKLLHFTYSGKLANKAGTSVKLYYMSKSEMLYALEIQYKPINNQIKGEAHIPDSAKALIFGIDNVEMQVSDNNEGNGYLEPVLTNGKEDDYTKFQMLFVKTPGSMAASILNLITNTHSLPSAQYAEFIKKYPSSKKDFTRPYFVAEAEEGKKDKAIIDCNQYFTYLLRTDGSESTLRALAWNISQLRTGQNNFEGHPLLKDSIDHLIITKFPKGQLAAEKTITKILASSNKDSIFTALQSFPAAYPEVNKTRFLRQLQPMVTVAMKELKEGNERKAKIMLPYFSSSNLNSIAWDYAEKGEHLDFAEEASKKSLDMETESKLSDQEKPTYYTKKEWNDLRDQTYASYEDSYSLILFKKGKNKEALAAQKDALEKLNWKADPEMNERYLQYLIANEQYTEAIEKGKYFVSSNQYNEKVKTYTNEAYAKIHAGENLNSYFAEMDKKAKEKQMEELRGKMLHETAQPFTLKDVEGNTVSLADYKGKIVVLDFWATWCGPCKRSFPGMQLAINKYKEDKEVAFLFIDTWEDDAAGAKKYVADNKFSFHVLVDAKNSDGKYPVVTNYGVTGIPTKFVVDQNGMLQFKMVGFSGSDDKVRDEVSAMIEVLKENGHATVKK